MSFMHIMCCTAGSHTQQQQICVPPGINKVFSDSDPDAGTASWTHSCNQCQQQTPPESFFTFSAGLFSIIRDEHSSGGEEVDRVCFDYSGDPGVFWLFKWSSVTSITLFILFSPFTFTLCFPHSNPVKLKPRHGEGGEITAFQFCTQLQNVN